ncbi:glycosyltransferase family 2 protein [uncultured Duncaniella sp.]|uniref:glycosyltransferase family 2 protein n=1 Tax=uncultured Duncaniella sp. TaxID=2768039 RepID=UPI0026701C31|nr:glycosyltransferase family 2 protein [uncultured Duncaniella sp.]
MITASIVTFHTKHDELTRLIECVRKSSIDHLYIIDNSSNDELREFIKSHESIHYIHSLNLGYGSGHNIAIRKSIEIGADYHVVLNPDIYWGGDVIGELTKYMDRNPDVGQVMPKVFYPDGRLQYLCKMCPSPMDLIFKRFFPSKLTEKRLHKFQLRSTRYDKPMNVPYLSGCFMFFRVEALKDVGLFDERFFMYPEDIDITRRMHAKYRTMFYPFVSIVHAHAAASKTNKKMLKIHILNMIKYFNKWGWLFDKERKQFNAQLQREISSSRIDK